jgi:ABC-2 type transport system ATP-binding protein
MLHEGRLRRTDACQRKRVTEPPIIHVDNLSFAYSRKPVLEGLSFSVGRGATGLLGPNGAGKSTLIKILLGFLKPARGGGTVLGIPLGRRTTRVRQRVGYMPEHECLIPALTAIRLVTYCGELYGMPWVEAMQRAHETLFLVGLGEARYREVGTFSSGMRQRIKLAQALVHAPEILFLDEPTNGLDPAGRREMLDLIRDIVDQGETSVVFSSHILHDVEAVCTEVVMLKKGRLVVSGNIDALKRRDQNVYEVRLKGDGREACVDALAAEGCHCAPGRRDMMRVVLPEGGDARMIFRAAQKAGVQVRHLMHQRDSLEDVFIGAVADTSEES